jgi:enoyl-CoA hydratase
MEQLLVALEELGTDPETRVVALRGSGASFCAGFDLASSGEVVTKARANDAVAEQLRLRETIAKIFAVWDFPKPVIAAVHGYCLAGATMLAALCDITVVADDARIGVSSVPLGGGFITPLWMHLVGPKRAKQMAFQPGETMTGRQAADWGWANYSVPPDDLLTDVTALAHRIARTPTDTLRMKKYAINRLCELQGFRAQAMLGAEVDALLHHSNNVAALWESIEANGLKSTIERFRAGQES